MIEEMEKVLNILFMEKNTKVNFLMVKNMGKVNIIIKIVELNMMENI